VEEVLGFSPCAGIVPCIGIGCPKPGLPPVGKVVDKKALLQNTTNKENDVEPIGILCEGGSCLPAPSKLWCAGGPIDC
jgi:hypothetical protein